MKLKNREINIFSMSALDLFASGMGAFILLAVIALPFFPNLGMTVEGVDELKQDLSQAESDVESLEIQLEQTVAQAETEIGELQEQVEQIIAEAESAAKSIKLPDIDIVVVIDLTYSMQDALIGLQEEIGDLTEIMFGLAPTFGIGVVAYTDDAHWAEPIRAYQITLVSNENDIENLVDFTDQLEIGFGLNIDSNDFPESLGPALEIAVNMNWRPAAQRRSVIVLTDAIAKDQGGTLQTARTFSTVDGSRSISVVYQNTESSGEDDEFFLQDLASAGNGEFVRMGGSMTTMLLKALL